MRVPRRLHVPDDLPVRAVTALERRRRAHRRAGAAVVAPRRAAAAVGGGRQRQDLGAGRALRRGGARGRHRARADPRDHLHRARRRRAARARARAPAGARRPRGRARHRGGVRRHLPRLLRAPAARPPAARRGSIPASRSSTRASPGACASWRSRRRCASSSPDARSEAVDLLAAYGVDRVRAMIEQVYAELRSRGQRLPRLPAAAGRAPSARATLGVGGRTTPIDARGR